MGGEGELRSEEAREICNRYLLVITSKVTFYPFDESYIKSFYVDKF